MYWDRLRRHSVSRRRLLIGAGAGALGAGAVGLVGCGGGEEKAGTPAAGGTQAAGQPKRGGHLQAVNAVPPPHFDPVLNSSAGTVYAVGPAYSRLWRPKTGAGVDYWDWTLEPDLAVSVEQPDKTTYIYKLRQGVKWHDKPPLNGRAFVAEDVVHSVRRALDLPASAIKGEFSMITSVRATDPQTVEIKTDSPLAPFNGKLGANQMWITPREVAEQKGDLKDTVIGTGPFVFDSYTPNVAIEYSRNPNYFGTPLPNVDKLTLNLIADQSAQDAAFTTGKLDAHSASDRRGFDRLKSAVSNMQSARTEGTGHYFYFRCDRPPFQDVRVRQAYMLTIDYEGLIAAFTSGEGKIDTLVPQGMKAWAVPPAQWGDGAKYHSKPDLAEAKKLLEAAGVGGGVDYDLYYSTQFAANRQAQSVMEAMAAGADKAGFKVHMKAEEYAVYAQRIQGTSEYSGMLHLPSANLQEPDDYIYTYLYPGARRFASYHKDPELDAMIIKQRQEFDTEARKKIIAEIERRNLVQNYFTATFSFPSYAVWQKRLQNYAARPDFSLFWAATAWLEG